MSTGVIKLSELPNAKVAELKAFCKQLGLSPTGTKNELIERIKSAKGTSGTKTATAASAEQEEEQLLGGDAAVTDEAVLLGEIEVDGSTSAVVEEALQLTAGDGTKPEESATAATKRPADTADLEKKRPRLEESDKKPLTVQERLSERNKRFAADGSVDADLEAKKKARAMRFGQEPAADTTTAAGDAAADPAVVDKLKSRAARFGETTNTLLTQLTADERKQKRLEKFGSAVEGQESETTTTTPADSTTPSADDVKKAARAARFGVTATTAGSEEEKKQQRAARFTTGSSDSAPAAAASPASAEKAAVVA